MKKSEKYKKLKQNKIMDKKRGGGKNNAGEK